MANRYGWGDNEPKILPGAQGGDRTNFFGIKIKALFTDLFAKLNVDANKLNGIQAGAEVNQNTFAKVKVGSAVVEADQKQDTLELVPGSNVTITPDAVNDKITIGLPSSLDVNVTGSAATCNGCGEVNTPELTIENDASNRKSGFYKTNATGDTNSTVGVAYAGVVQVVRHSLHYLRLILCGNATEAPRMYVQNGSNGNWGAAREVAFLNSNITGNADSATKLQTSRRINGVLFNGTGDITITAAANGGTSAACSGNAASATKLQTPRRINGELFDGTGDITITAASCSGNAASATKATQDSRGQQIDSTYIKGLSVSGRTVTYTRGNGTTGSFQTRDTTYTLASLGGAPKPQTAAGVGQWGEVTDRVPPGGTWAYIQYTMYPTGSGGNPMNRPGITGGIVAGGTPVSGKYVVWRIA